LAPLASKASASSPTVTVKPGDTAGKIAAASKPARVSLDQMLVAMLRTNPDAFIQDNINRIKAGAILTLPTQEQAAAEPQTEATQTIIAQSQDFNEFRRKFAGSAPLASVAPATRVATGKLQATVQDKKPAAATPDKLTLSKGAVAGKTNEDKLAQARNTQEAAARATELAKNIADLGKLAAAASTPAAVPAAPVVAPPASVPAPTPAPVAIPVTPAAPVSAATTVKGTASAAPSVASAPAKPTSTPPKVIEPAPEPSFIEGLLENPLLPIGGAALVALLAALGIYKSRQRKRGIQVDSSFLESSLAESFSGASGGQNVDTSDDLTTGSSMVYSPSQLDAADDVDPVAEADVYLAYGRDLQAEEILKDALRSNPQRVAIHQKLLEIYAKRRDTKSFESIAALAFNLTDGTGTEWEQICEKGLSIDPDNALYLPGGQPIDEQHNPLAHLTALDAALSQAEPTPSASAASAAVAPNPGGTDLDLDLDFSLDDADPTPPPVPKPELDEDQELIPTAFSSLDSPASNVAPELPLPTIPQEPQASYLVPFTESENVTVPGSFVDNLDFPTPLPSLAADAQGASLSLALEESADSAPDESASPISSSDMMSFDLGSLSLDLGDGPVTEPGAFVDEAMDPLETKLALANEFRAIGDDDGARALIEEVIGEATGDLKTKAQNALAKL
jgi:pilus assembly protein FimV